MASNITPDTDGGEDSLVPPQLPPFLANVFHLQPILGTPRREEVKLVHEAIRALNNFMHTPELRNTDLSTELSQHLFDIQMACHREKYPSSALPHEAVYEPPTLPSYISVQLKSVTGSPSHEDIASIHTALRTSESFANVPSIFDPDVHAQLSQHLFDLQLARHVQRSMLKRLPSNTPLSQAIRSRDLDDSGGIRNPGMHIPTNTTGEAAGSRGSQYPRLEPINPPVEATSCQTLGQNNNEIPRDSDLLIEIRDTLKNMNRVMIGSQNSLARGFNSSITNTDYYGYVGSYSLGTHSLINDRGELPEMYNLPAFKHVGAQVSFPVGDLSENILARYLRFYGIGEEMVEEGEELKIKSGMIDDARHMLSGRPFSNRQ